MLGYLLELLHTRFEGKKKTSVRFPKKEMWKGWTIDVLGPSNNNNDESIMNFVFIQQYCIRFDTSV